MTNGFNNNAGAGTGQIYHSHCAILRDQQGIWPYAERGGYKVSHLHGRVNQLCSLLWEQCLSVMW